MRILYHIAVFFSHLTYTLLRLLGRNASHAPGVVAMAICPRYLEMVPKARICICVTGTNGKTTAANMLTDCLTAAGYKTVSNRLGSNIAPGIAAALTNSTNWFGACKADATVFEVDERASRLILPYVKPDFLVVTNIFRDSLKRNANPDYIFSIINDYTPATTKLILNADDLASVALRPDNPRSYYGVAPLEGDITEPINLVSDNSTCPKCDTKLVYDYLRYHHIGHVHCPKCGFASPAAAHLFTVPDVHGNVIYDEHNGEKTEYPLVSSIVFNIYNESAVIACLSEIGLTNEKIQEIMRNTAVPDTRLKEEKIGDISVIMAMSKGQSCISSCRTFDYVSNEPGNKVVMLVLDDYYDRKNSVEFIGWIYDVDYEFMARPGVVQVAAAGPRCWDHRVRLLMAGVEEDNILCCLDELQCTELVRTDGVDKIYILYDTSTYNLAVKVKEKLIARLKREEAKCE